MNATDVLREIMKTADGGKRLQNADLAKRVGCTNAALFARLSQDNISVEKLVQMLEAMGYELIAQPAARGRRPDGCYLVNNDPKRKKEGK